ncbi:MAG: hypothetical protein JNK64_11820 [Myxococcales bacterium]|nr:hypothetical protein [Myxococcales bacterium]
MQAPWFRIAPLALVAVLAACRAAHPACPADLTRADDGLRLSAGVPSGDVTVATSGERARAIAAPLAAPPAPPPGPAAGMAGEPAGAPIEAPAYDERAALDAYVAATDFARFDLAVIRAGGARQSLAGVTPAGSVRRTTVTFSARCPPCGGGDPGSYMDAAASYDAGHRPWTLVIRVAKGRPVHVAACGGNCRPCRHDIP